MMTQTLAQPETASLPSATSTLLVGLFQTLDEAGIPYCVLHGYEAYPARVESDVDLLMPRDVLPGRLAQVLHANRAQLQARVVQWLAGEAHFVVLAGTGADGSPVFVQLHVSPSCDIARRSCYSAEEVLARRQRNGSFWVPATDHEFGWTLARRIEKGTLEDRHIARLDELYGRDPNGCQRQIHRLFGGISPSPGTPGEGRGEGSFKSNNQLASSPNPHPSPLRAFRERGPELRMRMIRRLTARGVPSFIARIAWGATRVLWRSIAGNRGLSVVVLGPDGSGKSSVVESLRQDLSPAFIASERRTFPPALLKRGSGSSSTPHAVRPRSWVSSVVRALGYWLVYYTMGYYFTVHRSLARGRLVVHDRHLVDALVDPKRYRYGGPTGLLRFIWRCARKPDLVVLLDAPADVIQSRKQEVPLAETQRQVREYRELVIAMPNGRIIDAARPLADVTADVNELVLTYLARRAARRLGLEPVA